MTLRAASLAVVLAAFLAACAGPTFDLEGHRGARGLAPENTLPAFARALSIGVTTLELDVGVTRDGVLVVAHDQALNPDITRRADGTYLAARGPAIHSLTLAEVRTYDVGRIRPGSRYAAQHPDQQPVDGTPIPRLSELFELVRRAGNRDVRFDIETKISPLAPEESPAPEPFARALVRAVRDAGVASRTTIQSFDWRTLQVVQREAPDIPTVYLSAQQSWFDNIGAGKPAGSPWTAGFQHADHGSVPKMIRAAGGRIWSVYFGDLDAAKLAEAKALGLTVVVWTVNPPAQIAAMMDLGVDGIISDRPDLVRAEMARRGMTLPKPTPIAAPSP